MIGVAAFDFDGTLSRRDTVVPFLRRFAIRPGVVPHAVRELRNVIGGLARRDRDVLRAAATRAVLTGVPHRVVRDTAEAYAGEVFGQLRPDTVERLNWHRDQSHRTVIVSASYEEYLLPIADRLGVDAVLATRLDIDAAGRCTGRLAGANCRAAEKVRRLDEWFAATGFTRDDVELWAYGDSSGDAELLDHADHPTLATGALANIAT